MEENGQKSKVILILEKIWPTVYKVINLIIYAIISFLKGAVKIAMDQLKGKI
ncbi:MAG: hypothetical protein AAB553_02180 [Patescibacteria group bacterium]